MGNQKSSSLPPQLVQELEGMTAFSYAEINDLYRQFRHDCPDKKMTVEQFRTLYRETFPNGDPDKFAELVFGAFDREGKGYINFQQFLTTLSTQLKGSFEEKLNWLFSLYDTNKLDYITKEALVEMITAVHSLHGGALPTEEHHSPEEIANHILHHAGVPDHPGRIYRSDFIRASMSSNTLASILQGTLKAADSPYLHRKERRQSLGIPLHHPSAAGDKRGHSAGHGPPRATSFSSADGRDQLVASQGGSGPVTAGARRPSLTPEMLDFNSMLNKH